MKPLGFAFAALVLLPGMAHAAAAITTCTPQKLTDDQRASLSDLVFVGKATDAKCECLPMADKDDSFGARVDCTDMIQILKPLKGQSAPSTLILRSMVLIDDNPEKELSEGTCGDRVDDRDDDLTGSERTFYLRMESGFYQTVPATICR